MNHKTPPGWEGAIGPFPGEYNDRHVYARDIYSGAGSCVCGRHLYSKMHIQIAPGVDFPIQREIAHKLGGEKVTAQKPTLCRMVLYRGKFGYFAMRAAIVNADVNSLDPRGVESGEVPALDSDMHAHLTVLTPGQQIAFPEFNVPYARQDENGQIPPGSWTWPTEFDWQKFKNGNA